MKYFATLICVLFASCAALQTKVAQDLNGPWEGNYKYTNPNINVPESVPFFVELRQNGEEISGTIQEPNTFGAKEVKLLTASFTGKVRNSGEIKFRKTYDGSGKVSHFVDYHGKIEKQEIRGRWEIPGTPGGAFTMKKIETSKMTLEQ